MKSLAIALVLLCASSASAQWSYVPIENSRSYNAYRGPVYPAYGYYPVRPYRGGYYYGMPVRVQVSQDPLDPLFPSRYGFRRW